MSSDSNEPKGSGVIPTSAPQSYYPPTEITQSMQDMVEILREIRDRQVATDNAARQPMPAKSARSSSAWAPLIRSHMANVQPTVDRWRGALDTLLVFIALFSSILTTFVVQSLTSLSQDPGEKTNELLTNLTDIILAISNTSFSHLDIPHSVPFTPERDAVRLNFYWCVALVSSVSVAVLAVTIRGYVAMLTRSHHPQASEKLAELHVRWSEAKRVLAPTVDVLPQLLTVPIILFIIGLLDNILTTSISLSKPSAPMLAAGILSCVFAFAVAAYAVWTVAHGSRYPERSPFQSMLSQHLSRLSMFVQAMLHVIVSIYRSFKNDPPIIWFRLIGYVNTLRGSPPIHTVYENPQYFTPPSSGSKRNLALMNPISTPVSKIEHEAFFHTLLHTHDDDILDEAAAALVAIRESYGLDPGSYPFQLSDTPDSYEMQGLFRLLSSEASIRSNVTAATFIASSPSFKEICEYDRGYLEVEEDRIHLTNLLVQAAQRFSLSITGTQWSVVLWNCPFTVALAKLARHNPPPGPVGVTVLEEHDIILAEKAPILGLLLSDFYILRLEDTAPATKDFLRFLRLDISRLALSVLGAKLPRLHVSDWETIKDGIHHFMEAQSDEILSAISARLNSPSNSYANLLCEPPRGDIMIVQLGVMLDQRCSKSEYYVLKALVQWLIHWQNGIVLGRLAQGLSNATNRFQSMVTIDHMSCWPCGDEADWLGFILDQLNITYSSMAKNRQLGSLPRSFCLTLTDAWVKTVRAMESFDRHGGADTLKFHQHPFGFPGSVEHKDLFCSPLCRFFPIFIRTLDIIRDELGAYPEHLQTQHGAFLHSQLNLTIDSTDPRHHAFYSPEEWTTLQHRNEIKIDLNNAYASLFGDGILAFHPSDVHCPQPEVQNPAESLMSMPSAEPASVSMPVAHVTPDSAIGPL